jgi:hypothetical protein
LPTLLGFTLGGAVTPFLPQQMKGTYYENESDLSKTLFLG